MCAAARRPMMAACKPIHAQTAIAPPAAETEAFLGQLVAIYTGSMLTYMIDIGHRTGLFTAAAAGPASSQALADRAGLHERYVREWLARDGDRRHRRLRPGRGHVHAAAPHGRRR